MIAGARPVRVLVTDAEERSALGCCRALSNAGYFVGAAGSRRPAAAHWSRACDRRHMIPDPRANPGEFVSSLQTLMARDYDVLIPASEPSLLAVSRGRAELEHHVHIALPPHPTLVASMNKDSLAGIAQEAGLPAPRTVECRDN